MISLTIPFTPIWLWNGEEWFKSLSSASKSKLYNNKHEKNFTVYLPNKVNQCIFVVLPFFFKFLSLGILFTAQLQSYLEIVGRQVIEVLHSWIRTTDSKSPIATLEITATNTSFDRIPSGSIGNPTLFPETSRRIVTSRLVIFWHLGMRLGIA